jgi:hypothetical protein
LEGADPATADREAPAETKAETEAESEAEREAEAGAEAEAEAEEAAPGEFVIAMYRFHILFGYRITRTSCCVRTQRAGEQKVGRGWAGRPVCGTEGGRCEAEHKGAEEYTGTCVGRRFERMEYFFFRVCDCNLSYICNFWVMWVGPFMLLNMKMFSYFVEK